MTGVFRVSDFSEPIFLSSPPDPRSPGRCSKSEYAFLIHTQVQMALDGCHLAKMKKTRIRNVWAFSWALLRVGRHHRSRASLLASSFTLVLPWVARSRSHAFRCPGVERLPNSNW